MDQPTPALTLNPIGYLRCAHSTKVQAARQPAAATDVTGVIELVSDCNLEHAIEDLAGWERIWVIFWFHHNANWRPKVLPPRSTDGRKGVLATRSPHRPNPLGLSVLRLDRIDGLSLHVRDVDLLDGTPVLDIKPYVPYSDAFPESGSGWLQRSADDPRVAWSVAISATAEAQLAWLAARLALPLRERIVATLSLGPQPHPYRRIKRARDGKLTLAVQDWRADFSVEARQITVASIRTGYQAAQLADTSKLSDDVLTLHRAFGAAFP